MLLSGEENDVTFDWVFVKLAGTRTGIKARTSLNLGRIRLFTLELFALERGFFSYRLLIGKR